MNDTSDKYANFSHDELVAEINRLKKHKKYGLVWEHKTEKVIEDFETQQPYLEEVTDKRIEDAPGEPTNLIIEGDNFEALSILNYTHAGKVDVIYIDPPYNTGNKDFIYNDNYVDAEDEFRHSKWLSFMEPRLKLAKNLLKDDGVIFISIDDNEQAGLKLLCDEILGINNFICNYVWQKNFAPKNDNKYISTSHEYILMYAKTKSAYKRNLLPRSDKNNTSYSNPDNDPRGAWTSGTCLVTTFSEKSVYEIEAPNGKKHIPPKGRCWRYSKDKFEKLMRDNRIWFGRDGNGVPRVKRFLSEMPTGVVPQTWLKYEDVGSGQDGARDLRSIFNGETLFSFPKPVRLMSFLIDRHMDKDAVVLDFFAGTGTTGQAVIELNKKDSGRRQFILCTNNENGIAENITYKRVCNVIKEFDRKDGIPANLRYYKINHREKKPSIDANRQDIVAYMENIIQVKENAYKQLEANEDFVIYESKEKYVGLVFEPFSIEEVIANLKELNQENRPVKLYVFSYSRDAFEDDYGADFEIEFVAMPEGLLKTYAHVVEEQKKEDL